jgi:hypothetical protein
LTELLSFERDRLTLSLQTLLKSPGIPSWVERFCETQLHVQLCSVSLPGAWALRTSGRVAAGRARQAEIRLVVAAIRRAVVGGRERICDGWGPFVSKRESIDIDDTILRDGMSDGMRERERG